MPHASRFPSGRGRPDIRTLHPEFLRGLRAVFDATWREAMGRRWPALAADVGVLCEQAVAVGAAQGRRDAIDALRAGATLEQLVDGLTDPR